MKSFLAVVSVPVIATPGSLPTFQTVAMAGWDIPLHLFVLSGLEAFPVSCNLCQDWRNKAYQEKHIQVRSQLDDTKRTWRIEILRPKTTPVFGHEILHSCDAHEGQSGPQTEWSTTYVHRHFSTHSSRCQSLYHCSMKKNLRTIRSITETFAS